MSLTVKQTDVAIVNFFYGMEKDVEYVINDFWFSETNRVRNHYGYDLLKDRSEYLFTRNGDCLFVNGKKVFDFSSDGKNFSHYKDNITFDLILALRSVALPFTLALPLQYNGIEKLNKDTCDGKVVEIDGRKYKLTAV